METKKQVKKQTKTQPLTALPVMPLNEKDMSKVSGGAGSTWSG